MTQWPLTSRSPAALPSHGSTLPSPSTMRMSTPNTDLPCFSSSFCLSSVDHSACLVLRRPSVPRGDISVMPQAWMTSTPYSFSKARIIAGGQAAPPITVLLKVLNFRPLALTWLSRPSQMVGTPADIVTFSSSKRLYSDAPSRWWPGITSLQPTIAAAYGRPQALTWNMGTTGSTVSVALRHIASGRAAANACSTVERCEYTAPLGLPVVPEV